MCIRDSSGTASSLLPSARPRLHLLRCAGPALGGLQRKVQPLSRCTVSRRPSTGPRTGGRRRRRGGSGCRRATAALALPRTRR
eukprot:3585602-Rhodomonas_salina.1